MPLQIPKTQAMKGRLCRNCTGLIPKPKGNNIKKKIFCSDNCRKEFHKNNGISVHKLKEQVRAWVRDEWKAILAERAELEQQANLANQTGVHVYNMEEIRKSAAKTTAHPEVHDGRKRISQ